MSISGAQHGVDRRAGRKKTGSGTNHYYYILSNRKHFYLNHALIFVLKKGKDTLYRLVVYHNKQMLMDSLYHTLRGARISFSKLYLQRGFNGNVKAEWSDLEEGDISILKPPLPPLPPLKLCDLAKELGKQQTNTSMKMEGN